MEIILEKRKSLNINDDFGIEKCWNEMTELLSQNEMETINYLEESTEKDLYYISEIFEDVSERFQSEQIAYLNFETFYDYLEAGVRKEPETTQLTDLLSEVKDSLQLR
ncbi:hypothetical protein [Listeria booriae]|uniref:hypothetical protein n=1 Tax=Listeria booriae TaxID=1552123 RepID=UPI001626B642|nr:hypothetical protein [Listeria booriae]